MPRLGVRVQRLASRRVPQVAQVARTSFLNDLEQKKFTVCSVAKGQGQAELSRNLTSLHLLDPVCVRRPLPHKSSRKLPSEA